MPTAESILGPGQVLDFAAGLRCFLCHLLKQEELNQDNAYRENKQKHTLSGSNQRRISQANINQPDPAATSCLRELCTVVR
jgi:hypothetical protein